MAERETKELYSKEGEKAYEVREDNYADCANEIMRRREQDFPGLTTTKLRGIYAHIVNLASRIGSQEEFEKLKGDLQYLKVKMAYEAGREKCRQEASSKRRTSWACRIAFPPTTGSFCTAATQRAWWRTSSTMAERD